MPWHWWKALYPFCGQKLYRQVLHRDDLYREVFYREVFYREVLFREALYRVLYPWPSSEASSAITPRGRLFDQSSHATQSSYLENVILGA